MNVKKRAAFVAGGLAVLAAAAPVVAHHAFGAEFDRDAPIKIVGRVARLEWVNPHTWIHIAATEVVKGSTGEIIRPADPNQEVWAVEGGTPNTLLRRGLRRECLAIGTVVVVDGYQTKDHSLKRANGRDITFEDGSKMFLGSSGTGAPYDADLIAQREAQGRC
jgi:hypothetical protein